jgi:hypothetical protein
MDDDDDDDDDINDDDTIFIFLLIWNTTMATARTWKSVQNYRNNNDKMPIILTRAQKGKQGNCKHFQCISLTNVLTVRIFLFKEWPFRIQRAVCTTHFNYTPLNM